MHKRRMSWAIVALIMLVALPACLGPNHTVAQLGHWNTTEFENKWSQEGIFLLVFPAYIVAGIGDILLFNTWQFWTGINPIEHPNSEFRVL